MSTPTAFACADSTAAAGSAAWEGIEADVGDKAVEQDAQRRFTLRDDQRRAIMHRNISCV